MSKRIHITLPEWLDEYTRFVADLLGIKQNEILRLNIAISCGMFCAARHPEEINFRYTPEEVIKNDFLFGEDNDSSSEKHKLLSDIYFESRKAIEKRMELENT